MAGSKERRALGAWGLRLGFAVALAGCMSGTQNGAYSSNDAGAQQTPSEAAGNAGSASAPPDSGQAIGAGSMDAGDA